jgi:mannosyltransferase
MTDATPAHKASEASGNDWPAAAGLVIVGLAIALRIPGLIEPRFWQDEMISLGIANGGLVETIIGTLRFSAHPPAYYAQLNLWMMAGKNASFIILNSVAWSVAAVAAIYYLGRQIIGEKSAALAALLFAIMPQSLWFAANARMYAMICFFQVLAWWSAEQMARTGQDRVREYRMALLGLCAAQLVIGFAHAIGPLFAACLGLFGLLRLWQAAAPRSSILRFLGAQIATGALLTLVLVNGMLRETQYQPPEDLMAMIRLLTHALYRPRVGLLNWVPAALIVYGLGIMAVFADARLRMAALTLMILPIAALIVISLTFKPVLGGRVLSMMLPFIALCCAGTLTSALSAARGRAATAGACGLCLIVAASFITASAVFIATYQKPHDFRTASADLRRDLVPEDVIITLESPPLFWGLGWQLAGPESVNALKIQSPANERWQVLFNKLGDNMVDRLGLKPEGDTLSWNGIPIILGRQGMDRAMTHKRMWLVYFQGDDISGISTALSNNNRIQAISNNYRGLVISRYDARG